MASCNWTWGVLAALPFLPRVTSGRVVLCRATWRVTRDEISSLNAARGAERYAAVQTWRASRRLPRWVVVSDVDNTLPIDLDNAAAADMLVHLLKGRAFATLTELYPSPDELCAVGTDGRYVHELVIPFLRNEGPQTRTTAQSHVATEADRSPLPSALRPIQRTFAPGSEWIYAKLYTGTTSADRLLSELVAPLSRRLLASGSIDRWFFIRFNDPDNHLRWRLHVPSITRLATLRRRIETAAAAHMADGPLRRLVFDTYEREVERFGGSDAIVAAEQWFWADSESVIDLLALLDGSEAAANERWQLAIPSVDTLLTDLQLDLDGKLRVMQRLRAKFGREFHADAAFGRQLSTKFRHAKDVLQRSLERADRPESSTRWSEALARRSARTRPIIDALAALARTNHLTVTIPELAESYVHMHLNRLFRAQQRAHELVIYDFLVCLYEAHAARRRSWPKAVDGR